MTLPESEYHEGPDGTCPSTCVVPYQSPELGIALVRIVRCSGKIGHNGMHLHVVMATWNDRLTDPDALDPDEEFDVPLPVPGTDERPGVETVERACGAELDSTPPEVCVLPHGHAQLHESHRSIWR